MEEETKDQDQITSPFCDVDLEFKILRCLIMDERKDDLKLTIDIGKNIGFLLTMNFSKECFTSPFRQNLFDELINNFAKFSEPLTRSVFIHNIKKRLKSHLEIKKEVILLDKVFAYEIDGLSFKPLAEEVKNFYTYRRLSDLAYSTHMKLKDHHTEKKNNSVEVAQHVSENISKILSSSERFRTIEQDIFHDIDKDFEDIRERRLNPEKYKGISTGYEKIDRATGGWAPGELSIILGRPGMGKSILLLNFAYHAYKERYNVFYVTIEMPIEQQKKRLFCRIADLTYNKVKMPHYMSESEYELFERRIRKEKESQKNHFWFLDAPQKCNSTFIESRIIAFENSVGQKIDLVIVDPLYLMQPSDSKTDDPVGAISWDLKLLARKMNFPVLAASQFNREGGKRHQHGKGVDTMDAAFSDKLGNNADNMIAITGDNKYAKLSFPKTRDSNIQDVHLEKEFAYMRFKYNPEETEDDVESE